MIIELPACRYAQHWEGLADRWADFGRLHLLHLKCQTNNLLERFFNTLKYSFMSGRKCSQMADLVRLLLTKVIPAYMHERLLKKAGRTSSQPRKAAEARRHRVQQLVQDVQVLDPIIATALIPSFSEPTAAPHQCCFGDLSCDCHQSRYGVCQHLEALQQKSLLDTPPRAAAAAELIRRGMINVLDAGDGICEAQRFCPTKHGSSVPFKLSLRTGICDCWDWLQSHLCCHLMAAHQLPDLQAIPAVMLMPLRTQPAIPSGSADDDGLCMHLQAMSQATAAVESGQVSLQDQLQNQICSLKRMNSKWVYILPRLSADARQAMLDELEAVQGRFKEQADRSGLQPSAVQAGRKQRRQETRKGTDRTHKPLYPSRQHAAGPTSGEHEPVRKRPRSGLPGEASADDGNGVPTIPRNKAQGRPVTNVSAQLHV